VIADPTSFEEPLLDSNVTVVLQGNEAISVSQGGLGTSQKTAAENPVKLLSDCVDAAKRRQSTVQQVLMEALKPAS
jgi:exosome complex component RRP43